MVETIVRRPGEEGITPFWRRIPRFFLYPLAPQPLLFMVGLACVTRVLSSMGAHGHSFSAVMISAGMPNSTDPSPVVKGCNDSSAAPSSRSN